MTAVAESVDPAPRALFASRRSLVAETTRAPDASGPRDPRQDDADHQEDSAEQHERERVGPGVSDHRGARVRRAMSRSQSELSPRNARARTHRIM